jgi:hypothetical protein
MPGPCDSTCCTRALREAGRRRCGSCRTCCTAPAVGCRIRIAAGRRGCASTRPGCCRSGRTGHGASGASSARSAECRRRPGSRALVPAAKRAGSRGHAITAAAPGGPVSADHGQGGSPAVAALPVVGRVAAEARAADRVADRGAAADIAGPPAAAACFEPVPVIAPAAAAHSPETEPQRHRLPHDGQAGTMTPGTPASARALTRTLTRGEPCAPSPLSSAGRASSSHSTW